MWSQVTVSMMAYIVQKEQTRSNKNKQTNNIKNKRKKLRRSLRKQYKLDFIEQNATGNNFNSKKKLKSRVHVHH